MAAPRDSISEPAPLHAYWLSFSGLGIVSLTSMPSTIAFLSLPGRLSQSCFCFHCPLRFRSPGLATGVTQGGLGGALLLCSTSTAVDHP